MLKENPTKNTTIEVIIRSGPNKAGKEHTIMNKGIAKFVAVVAIIFAFASPVTAQNLTLEDAQYLWFDKDDPAWEARNPVRYGEDMYSRDATAYFKRVEGTVKTLNKQYVKGKSRKSFLNVMNPFVLLGLEVFTALTPVELKAMESSSESYLDGHSCKLGTPDSSECKDLYDNLRRINDGLDNLTKNPETQGRAKGFMENVSLFYTKNEDRNIPTTNFAKLALYENAAIFSRHKRLFEAFILGENNAYGKEASYEDLTNIHGDLIVSVCIGIDNFWGTLNGETSKETFVVDINPRDRHTSPASSMGLCRFFLKKGGSASRCEVANEAFDAGAADFEGSLFVRDCPTDETLKGQEVLYFPENCTEPTLAIITNVLPGVGIVLGIETQAMDPSGNPLVDATGNPLTSTKNIMIPCADITSGKVKIVLVPETSTDEGDKVVLLGPSMFTLSLGGIYGWMGINSNAEGTHFAGGLATLGISMFANQRFAAALRLSAGVVYVLGNHKNASEPSDSRGDFLGAVGIGGTMIFSKAVSLDINADVLFTTAGFGGVMGSALLKIRVADSRVSIFFGPGMGWHRFGVAPGTNPIYDSCNHGADCADAPPNHIEGGSITGQLGISINLSKRTDKTMTRAQLEEEFSENEAENEAEESDDEPEEE